MSTKPYNKILSLLVAVLVFWGSAYQVLASDVNVAVVDVTAPTGAVTLIDGNSASITINLSVTGSQAGTATFEVYRTWTLSQGTFVGSNPQEFTVAPRAGGDPATTFSTTGTVVVASGQEAGTFTLSVGAFDITNSNSTGAKLSAGTSGNYTVTVENAPAVDTTPPQITVPEDITKEATGPDGAVVTFEAAATDLVDGAVAVTYSQDPGTMFKMGETIVTVTATDKAKNTDTKSFKVTVVDTTAPKITVPDDITAKATGPDGAVVNFEATATDLVDGAVKVIYSQDPGTKFKLGQTTVTVTATDKAKNTDTKSFTVTIKYDFSGFFQPIDMVSKDGKPVLNRVKAGSAIPIKFTLGGDMGMDIMAAEYPKSVNISAPSAATVDEIETVVAASNSGLTYDAASGQYNYVWKTDKNWAGTYRRLIVKLIDGTTQTVEFQFVK